MNRPDVGVVVDGFGQPVKQALQSASQLQFRRVELPVVGTEVDPAQLSRSGRRHLAHYVRGLGLSLEALGADLGGGRLTDASHLERGLDKTRSAMELAAELHVPIVTSHLGLVTEDALRQGYLREALSMLAEASDRTGIGLAFETGGAEPVVLRSLLKEIDSPTVGVCYDPASLLIDGIDPMDSVETFADRILIARARDAVAGLGQRSGREAAIGQGQVDFAELFANLDQAGYRQGPMIRRTDALHPREEIARAKAYLESIMR